MKSISLIVAGALACLLIASVGTAAAETEIPSLNRTCTTSAMNVAGQKIKTKVTGKNVASSQKQFAACSYVNKAVKSIVKQEIEKPTVVEGFRVTPSVISTTPDVVKYSGLLRGADTATEIRINFKITYANN
ncbi:MAG TPA: hypothetical protein VHV53_09000 [Solirubrobacterales bacterium]|jgi:hypothetical protein|nr:hypothetical protein [Solirubrobacterales bacterium]